ncbi:hypothetical protein EYC80_010989 [Monilinia laxa]|uniref:Uncharacterized protein n=1 Tax=Monilinia laxa TaxID=61186 RepID=A0A5N6JQE9_MONLA|nr:hypothetical protein EYC80_010989 [Monilinia laxa]
MNNVMQKSRPSRFSNTCTTIPEDAVVTDFTAEPFAANYRRRMTAVNSPTPPERQTRPPNFSESSILDIRLMHPSRNVTLPHTPLESSTTTPAPTGSRLPSLGRTSSLVRKANPAESTIVVHPNPLNNTRINPNHLSPAPLERVDEGIDLRISTKDRICFAMRDLWVEVKSRIKWESKSKRKARKEKEVKRRESVARTKAVDVKMANQINDHRQREERRNSNAREKEKQNKTQVKGLEERNKVFKKKTAEKEERERKEREGEEIKGVKL